MRVNIFDVIKAIHILSISNHMLKLMLVDMNIQKPTMMNTNAVIRKKLPYSSNRMATRDLLLIL